MKKIRGTSLLELLLCLLLSAIIVASLTSGAMAVNTMWLRQQKLLTQQESGLVARHYLQFAIAHAGYMGCQGVNHRHLAWITPQTVSDDKLSVQYMSPKSVEIIDQPSPTQLLVSGLVDFTVGKTLVVENCWQADVAQLLQMELMGNETVLTLNHAVSDFSGGEVAPLISNTFFVKSNGRGSKSLYVLADRNAELVEGVDQLNIWQTGQSIEATIIVGDQSYFISQTLENS